MKTACKHLFTLSIQATLDINIKLLNLTLTHILVPLFTVKPSKPRCWMEGRLLEGSDVKLSCKSSDGSDPIHYKWERVLDKGKSVGKLPTLALIGESNTPKPAK